MQKALLASAVAAALALPINAQGSAEQCGPPLTTAPAAYPELGSLNLGVQEVGQIFVIPNPGVGTDRFLGCFTGVPTNQTDYDFGMFTWTPGTAPTVLNPNPAAIFNTSGDEFQMSIDNTGLIAVGDGGANNGTPFLALRGSVTTAFPAGNQLLDGANGNAPFTGYIDPQLATIGGQLSIFWVDANNNISVGDLNPATRIVSNQRVAVAAQNNDANFRFWHSPTGVRSLDGNSRGLICSKYDVSTGSDGYYQSTGEASTYGNAAGIKPYLLHNDGGDWNANPLAVNGTAIYADAGGGAYGDPLRLDYFAVNSDFFDANAGGTVRFDIQAPLSTTSPLVTVLNFGPPSPPLDLGTVGLGIGWVCVAPLASAPGAPIGPGGGESTLSITLPGGAAPSGTALPVQALALDTGTGGGIASNQAVLEAR